MSTDYGNFHNFCRDSTLPVCNLFSESVYFNPPGDGFGGCQLLGIPLSGGRHLRNLGSIILDGIGILVAVLLLWRSQKKRAAVGRREMQLFLLAYILIDICEIFSIGGFPLKSSIRTAFSGIHIGAITAASWILMLNGAVGYQAIDDGTIVSLSLIFVSAALIFIATGYIALDTGYSWSGHFDSSLYAPNRNYALYTLYLLLPIVFLFIYFVLEAVVVIKVLGETRPLLYLCSAVLLFAIGQIFDFVISVHICNGTHGKVDGALFETFFTLLAVVMVWVFWSSITEDDWPATDRPEDMHQIPY